MLATTNLEYKTETKLTTEFILNQEWFKNLKLDEKNRIRSKILIENCLEKNLDLDTINHLLKYRLFL